MKYLLDTCTFLWLTNKPAMLSLQARQVINDSSNVLFFSDVSIWEISLKIVANKLPFPHSIRSWVPLKRKVHQVERLLLSESAIYRSVELPPEHRDPFDRILSAQCLVDDMNFLSPDEAVDCLGVKRVW